LAQTTAGVSSQPSQPLTQPEMTTVDALVVKVPVVEGCWIWRQVELLSSPLW